MSKVRKGASALNFPLEFKDFVADEDRIGEFVGLASVYGVKDLHNEAVMPGAFTKTIAERGGRIKLLYQHDVTRPIGIGEVSDSEAGLILRGRLAMNTAGGREAYEQVKAGVIDSLSIGFDTIKEKVVDKVRQILEIRLWEVSLVTFPANTLATISAIKAAAYALPEGADDLAVELGDSLVRIEADIREGRLAGEPLTQFKSRIEAVAALLVDTGSSTGTADPVAAEVHVEPEHLHSLREVITNAKSLATAR